MKKLKKILLINWLYFSKELIEVGDVNFLTGKNGAGKSTVIDALQIVLLGETNARNFNQAASEKSQRTLDSYLRADMDENNPYILDYKHFAEQALGHELEFEHIGGATDSRAFAVRGSIVIMHSGTGEGMHAEGEYVEVDSVEKIADIQIKFLDKLAKDLQ